MKKYQIGLLFVGVLVINACKQSVKKETIEPELTPEVVDQEIKVNIQSPIYGIDISKYQHDEIDLINKSQDSLHFIICKATEGITYTDPDFSDNWKMIKEKGFIRGAYHFYISHDDPKAQAENYLNTISNINDNDLPPIIDIEGGGIDKLQSIDQVQSTLLSFLKIIENKLNITPIIYTNVSIGNKYLNTSEFANYPLWIASYGEREEPDLPSAWTNKGWLIWQKSDDYEVTNIKNDFDVFNGSLTEFNTFIKQSWKLIK